MSATLERKKQAGENVMESAEESVDRKFKPRIARRLRAIDEDTLGRLLEVEEEIRKKISKAGATEDKEPNLPFLDHVWEGKNTPTDLARNHDHYLYDK